MTLPWIRRFARHPHRAPRIGRRRRTALLTALALAGPALAAAVPATASAAPATVHSGWNNFSCRPSAQHPRPVVLVHGTFENGTDNWLVLAPYLEDRGYCVFSFSYGQLSGIPVIDGIGPIAHSAQQLSDFVNTVRSATGSSKVDLVGHSQGGMMPRYYLKFLGGASKVNALIGLAPINHGTTLDGITKIVKHIPGAAAVLARAVPQGVKDELAGSAFLAKLNAGGDTVPGVHYTVIATKYDEVVTPYTSQFLSGSGVRNILIQNLCAVDVSEHIALGTVDRIAFHEVANALDPAHATRTTCASAL